MINFDLKSAIDLPDGTITPDCTDCSVQQICINNEVPTNIKTSTSRDSRNYYHTMDIPLQHSDTYDFIVKRYKILCKKTNPEKFFHAKTLIKTLKITVIGDAGINLGFYKMGTVHAFAESNKQTNQGITVSTWNYFGLILPHQGFILIFK